jgi:hypothetical protein
MYLGIKKGVQEKGREGIPALKTGSVAGKGMKFLGKKLE